MDPTLLDFLLTFSAILWEAMPFIVVGAVIAGVLEEFLPQQFITRILPPRLLPSVMVGAGLGLVFPMCECGIVVVMRRLLRKGLPLACCIAYLLAGPIINLVVIFSTWFAFRDHKIGPEMVGLRCGLGFLVAVVTALIVHWQYRLYGSDLLTPLAHPRPPGKNNLSLSTSSSSESVGRRTLFQRLSHISATALHDFVDITVFLILGAVLAAVAKQYIAPDEVERLSREAPLLVIGGMMVLAALMCLCSEADAFVAASFTSLHISGKLAFLVYGPMIDIKLMMMYTRIFRPRLILIIFTAVTIQVFLYTALIHLIYQLNGWTGLPG